MIARHRVDLLALAIAVLATIAALVLALPGYFWSDDWVMLSQLANEGLGVGRMVTQHGGHLQPGTYLLFSLGKLIGGSLPWVAMSVLAGVLLLVALLTTWWAVRELVGPRPIALLPLLVVSVSALTYSTSSWLIVSTTYLPVWIASASAIIFHTRYLRQRRRADLVAVIASFVAGTFFLERAIFIPVLLFAITAAWFVRGPLWPSVKTTWRTAKSEWLILLALLVPYLLVVVWTGQDNGGLPTLAAGVEAYLGGLFIAIPAILSGGPWQWFSLGNPNAAPAPPHIFSLFAVILWVTVVAFSLRIRLHALRLWLPLLVFVLWSTSGLVLIGRVAGLGWSVVLTPRQFADGAPLMAATIAVAFLGLREEELHPYRNDAKANSSLALLKSRWLPVAATVVLVAGGLFSLNAYAGYWQKNPSRTFTNNYLSSLANQPDVELFNDYPPIAGFGLLFPVPPWDSRQEMFAVYDAQPQWVTQSDSVNVVTADGHIVPGGILGDPIAMIPGDPCGTKINDSVTFDVPKQPPSAFRFMTVDYFSDAAGSMTVRQADVTSTFDLKTGVNQRYLQTSPTGDTVSVSVVVPPGTKVCLRGLVIGQQLARR